MTGVLVYAIAFLAAVLVVPATKGRFRVLARIPLERMWMLFAGLAGAIYTFSKGAISPDSAAIPRSVDGLVMVLLGGIQTLTGPVAGAAAFTWLQDTVARETAYWRAMLGGVILLLVLAFPQGLTGYLKARLAR